MSDATGLTASLTGIGGRHLLQGPPPPVTDQLVTALTSAGNDVVGAGTGLLGTLEVLPSPPARHLLQRVPATTHRRCRAVERGGFSAASLPSVYIPVAQPHLVASLLRTHLATACASGDLLPPQLRQLHCMLTVWSPAAGPAEPPGHCGRSCERRDWLHWIPHWHRRAPPPAGPPSPGNRPAGDSSHRHWKRRGGRRDWTAHHSGGAAYATSPLNSCTFR